MQKADIMKYLPPENSELILILFMWTEIRYNSMSTHTGKPRHEIRIQASSILDILDIACLPSPSQSRKYQ